jgi:hypothetical protein
MAPEQAGGNIDHRADIYALGVVLYEMLTGERPDKELIAPSRKVQIDVRLDEVVLRALERKPELRFQQATALKTSLQTIADQDASERTHPQMTSYPVPLAWIGYEYRSNKTLLGLPLLHVAQGLDPLTGQPRHARGIIAIGGVATGWLAMGGRAYGVIAFGGIAVGVFSLGGVAIGMVSVGGLTLALVLALGGMAIAPIALGGMAIGYLTMGGQGIGVHVVNGRHQDMAWLHQSYRAYQAWLFGVLGAIWLVLLACSACISAWAKSRALGDRNPSHASDKNSGHLGEWALGLFIGAMAGVPVFLGFMGTQEAMVLCGLALLLSWVLGLMSWRSQSGKFAAIASGLGLLLLVAFTFKFLAPFPPQTENVPGISSRLDSAPPTFGPVIERVVTYGESLMLKTGTTVHEMPGRFGDSRADQNSDGPKLFLRRSGVPEIKWMLWYRNMELLRLSEVDWSTLSVPELEEKFAQEVTKTAGNFANLPGLPRILEGALQEGFYGFKNSDAAGLLQVVSIADDGVKVRYKLLPEPKRKSDPPPDFDVVRKRATEYAIIYYPNLEISEDGARFTMQRNLREYDVHNGSKSGEVSAETHKETGPAADGFRLVLVPLVEAPVSQAFQADGPQIIDRPYWKSYVDHRFDPEKRSGVAMYFDFGPAVNEGLKDEMLGLLAEKPDAGSNDEISLQTIDNIKNIEAINDTNRFLDLELAVIGAKSSGLGDDHPSVIVASEVLARFKKTHPKIPDAVWQQLVGQRLEKAREQLATFVQNGLGNEHPVMVVQQARIRALTDMLREPE